MRRVFILGFLFLVGCPDPGPGPAPGPVPPPVPTADAAPLPADASDPTGCTAACANMKTQKCPEGLMDNCAFACISVQTSRLTEFNPLCVAAARTVTDIQKCGKAVKCIVK